MKTAIIFPGQGSQSVGMGNDFYENYQSSRKVYDELDKFLEKGIEEKYKQFDVLDCNSFSSYLERAQEGDDSGRRERTRRSLLYIKVWNSGRCDNRSSD